jgi:hypothetical protein
MNTQTNQTTASKLSLNAYLALAASKTVSKAQVAVWKARESKRGSK